MSPGNRPVRVNPFHHGEEKRSTASADRNALTRLQCLARFTRKGCWTRCARPLITYNFDAMESASSLPVLPSDRKFGFFFAAVFCLAGLYTLWKLGAGWYLLLFAVALVFAGLAAAAPARLHGLNRLWFRFGMLLGRVVSPIVLGVLFFGIITPTALIARLAGRDELRVKRRQQTSYWVPRDPAGPSPDSYKNQF